MSERHACRVVKQPRGTQRYRPTRRDDEGASPRLSLRWPASILFNTLTSLASRRVYEYAIEGFITWYCSERRGHRSFRS